MPGLYRRTPGALLKEARGLTCFWGPGAEAGLQEGEAGERGARVYPRPPALHLSCEQRGQPRQQPRLSLDFSGTRMSLLGDDTS